MRLICKIISCILLSLSVSSGAADRLVDCHSGQLSMQQQIVACGESAQDANLSRSVRAYAWLRRGYVLLELGRPEEALVDFDQAVVLYKMYAEAHLGRGLALTDVNRLRDADRAFTNAININPDMAEAFNNRGIVRGRLSSLDAAIEDYTQAIRLSSSFADAFNNRGTAYYEKKLFQRALIEFDEALRISPNRADTLYNRAVSYAALGRTERALREFHSILKVSPTYARALFNRGELHERLGDQKAAIRDWKMALELEPELPVPSTVRKIADIPEQPAAPNTKEPRQERGETGSTIISPVSVSLPEPVPPVKEESKAQARKKVALIIGNGNYEHTRKLANPTNDAKAITQALGDNGFDIHALVLDDGRNELLDALKSFSVAARNAEVALVFFAGHGLEVDGRNYMVPVDAKLEHQTDLAFEAIELEQILAVVQEASELGVVILDACRDNPFLDSMQLNSATRSLARGLTPIEPRRGALVAYAAKHGTVAYDGQGQHSPYTQALLDNITTSDLDVSLMFRRVSDQVWKATDGKQLPYIYGSLPGEAIALVNTPEQSAGE